MTVPPITCVEPVYPEGADRSMWVECTARWDADEQNFINRDVEAGWELDDMAFGDSVYIVEGTEYDSMDEAMHAALGPEAYGKYTPLIVLRPDDDHDPEWDESV